MWWGNLFVRNLNSCNIIYSFNLVLWRIYTIKTAKEIAINLQKMIKSSINKDFKQEK